ncbi:hypothetical protein FA15DRAFT_703198 [Coprinopsis marcescibilis]|nr:hypothetical protein FA15DRAFT_703198 [Coprinopsis marcescibilis]
MRPLPGSVGCSAWPHGWYLCDLVAGIDLYNELALVETSSVDRDLFYVIFGIPRDRDVNPKQLTVVQTYREILAHPDNQAVKKEHVDKGRVASATVSAFTKACAYRSKEIIARKAAVRASKELREPRRPRNVSREEWERQKYVKLMQASYERAGGCECAGVDTSPENLPNLYLDLKRRHDEGCPMSAQGKRIDGCMKQARTRVVLRAVEPNEDSLGLHNLSQNRVP